ncbi:MAG: DUF5678 domain-containing protein [Candidatus Aenigmatarchaeota archaeon]
MESQELQILKEMKEDEEFLKENYSKLREKYPDKFIAIKKNKVIADGADIDTVKKKLEKKAKTQLLQQ